MSVRMNSLKSETMIARVTKLIIKSINTRRINLYKNLSTPITVPVNRIILINLFKLIAKRSEI